MHQLLITISREFGSGCGEIGEKLAEKLGISCYDRQLLEHAAERRGLNMDKAAKYDERLSSMPISWLTTDGGSVSSTLYTAQAALIREIAERESAVFVGRCADDVLEDLRPIRIFLYASKAVKIERTMRKENLTDAKKAEALVNRYNLNRKNHYEFFTLKKWKNPDNYDLMVDTTRLGIDRTVALLAAYIQQMTA